MSNYLQPGASQDQSDRLIDDDPRSACEHGVLFTEACHAGECFREDKPEVEETHKPTFPPTKTLALTEGQLEALRAALITFLYKHQDLIKLGVYESDSYMGEAIRLYNMQDNLRRGEARDWNLDRTPQFLRI